MALSKQQRKAVAEITLKRIKAGKPPLVPKRKGSHLKAKTSGETPRKA